MGRRTRTEAYGGRGSAPTRTYALVSGVVGSEPTFQS